MDPTCDDGKSARRLHGHAAPPMRVWNDGFLPRGGTALATRCGGAYLTTPRIGPMGNPKS